MRMVDNASTGKTEFVGTTLALISVLLPGIARHSAELCLFFSADAEFEPFCGGSFKRFRARSCPVPLRGRFRGCSVWPCFGIISRLQVLQCQQMGGCSENAP